MNTLIFEGVRCFHTRQECSLKPITLLVGENSSGKTTFLALTRIAWDIALGDLSEDLFNEEPFLLGAYDQVATYRGGKAGRVRSFTMGLKFSLGPKFKESRWFAEEATISARFVPQGAQSNLDEWSFVCGQVNIEAKMNTEGTAQGLRINTPTGTQGRDERLLRPLVVSPSRLLRNLPIFFSHGGSSILDKSPLSPETEIGYLRNIFHQMDQAFGPRPYASAPIRTRPQRTHDPLKDVPKPEGSHVPMVLARMAASDSSDWEKLKSSLRNFGKASGLFTDVEIRRKGNKDSDPFQIAVKMSGSAFNLVDVGYGVSQVLPIVVDALQEPPRSNFLLQQPEVHLHPKAQAELGSFLAVLAKEHKKRFIIETHSDYLVDRIRMDIRDKKSLTPDDVAILYFERTDRGVQIHPLELDRDGNIVNAPSTYRQFFLAEERRLLAI
ncbi:MAG: DUF3696 domain-containing protein [Deltaproteobacteria bacterium]|nr:DUF3696 domain-containing protein [Deltaproteobacteria bacterium]